MQTYPAVEQNKNIKWPESPIHIIDDVARYVSIQQHWRL